MVLPLDVRVKSIDLAMALQLQGARQFLAFTLLQTSPMTSASFIPAKPTQVG